MFGNWKQKYEEMAAKFEAERAAHLVTVEFDDAQISGLTAHQHQLIAKHQATVEALQDGFRHEKDAWKATMALKDALGEKERARLEGKAEAFAADANTWRWLIHGDLWHSGGKGERNGRVLCLWERLNGSPKNLERILLPEGEDPNAR